jgi:amidohydrolase
VKAVSEGIAAAMGAEIEANILFGVPATINAPEMAAIVREAATELVGPERVVEGTLKAASEDMSEFLNRVPGCYFFVGSRNEEKGYVWGHHHARFDIDEEAMATGIGILAGAALRFLEQNA